MPNTNMNSRVILTKFQVQPETLQWLQAVPNPVSPTVISCVNQFIAQCKVDGNWQLLDRFWLFAQDNQANARISIKNPTSTAITEVNSPTWTSLQGYTGNGTTQYLNLNYNESTSGVNFTLNSNSLFCYNRTDVAGSFADMGHTTAAHKTLLWVRDATNVCFFPNNIAMATASPSFSNSDSRGLFHVCRTSAASTDVYKNGTNLGNNTLASVSLVNNNNFALAFNSNGAAASFSSRQMSMVGFGGGGMNASKFNDAFQTLATQLGFNV